MLPIPAHVEVMEALRMAGGNDALVEEMKLWLLKQKQTTKMCIRDRRMIPPVPDTVETSSNLAIVIIADGKAEVRIWARSSCDTMKDFLADSLTACFAMAGMKVELSGGYSGWQPNVDSPILLSLIHI